MSKQAYQFFKITIAAFLVSASLNPLFAQQEQDYDAEIARMNKEISRIKSERAGIRKETEKDRAEFTAYQDKNRIRRESVIAETDSIRAVSIALSRQLDSINRIYSGISDESREIDFSEKRFRNALVSLCTAGMAAADSLPPMAASPSFASMSFLKSELAAGTIDNIEGLNRLIAILDDMQSRLMDIQVVKGESPVAGITGSCYRIRIGGVFEAVTDEKGERCALWDGRGKDSWKVFSNPDMAGRILKAIAVREGKTMPVMVLLPFGADLADSVEQQKNARQ
jgi:hypothetical protein